MNNTGVIAQLKQHGPTTPLNDSGIDLNMSLTSNQREMLLQSESEMANSAQGRFT